MVRKGKTVDDLSYMIENEINKEFIEDIRKNLKKIT